ncbi:MAG: dTMP kinase [Desulfobacteraceae bacterium]|nr:dTMP kinase [Desulfobacteraceae bacterium]
MFITLEGIEGSGKTTQLQKIVAFLEGRGYECVTSREPGGTAIGAQIRAVLLNPANKEMDAGTELLLYVADRVQHIRTFIEPHLAAGRVVLCDRFFDATLVYQGYARGLDRTLIAELHRLVCGNLKPDVTLLFDLEPRVGLSRAWQAINSGGRSRQETRFEQEKLAFHQKVRDGYLDLARLEPHRFRVIDASGDIQEITRTVEKTLGALLPAKR